MNVQTIQNVKVLQNPVAEYYLNTLKENRLTVFNVKHDLVNWHVIAAGKNEGEIKRHIIREYELDAEYYEPLDLLTGWEFEELEIDSLNAVMINSGCGYHESLLKIAAETFIEKLYSAGEFRIATLTFSEDA